MASHGALSFVPPPPWQTCTSRSTGAVYFFNSLNRQSLWHDPLLPNGWAWAKASESAPRHYVNLFTGQIVHDAPTMPAAAAAAPVVSSAAPGIAGTKQPRPWSSDEQAGIAGPHDAKRARRDDDSAGITSAAANAPVVVAAPKRPVAVMPGMPLEDRTIDRPDDKPAMKALPSGYVSPLDSTAASGHNSRFFNEAHRTVLRQLCASVKQSLKSRVEWEAEHRGADHADEDRAVPVWDIGCGDGYSTAYLMAQLPPSAELYCIDSWDAGYYVDSLREFGNDEAADELAARYRLNASGIDIDSKVNPYHLFLNAFWDELRVIPVHYPAYEGLLELRDQGIEPALVWLDCDLHAQHLKPMLRELIRRFPRALIAGGGWDLSPEVRSSVMEVQRELLPDKRLHVELGQAWTLNGELIKETRNTADDANKLLMSAAEASKARAEVVESEAIRLEQAQQEWHAAALSVVLGASGGREAKEADLAALRQAIGRHGRPKAGVGSSSSSDDTDDCWIDVGDSSKEKMTLLMHACKLGKEGVARALIEEHGADVRLQAGKSSFTALGLAAYEGHVGIVRLLLAHGANVLSTNRFNETPLANAVAKRRQQVVEILRPLTEAAMAEVKAKTPPSEPATITLDHNGTPRTLTLRRVTATDTPCIQSLYEATQLEQVTDEVSRRVRAHWTRYIFATDLSDIDSRYSAIPRACFWVATVGPEDFRALVAATVAAAAASGSTTKPFTDMPPIGKLTDSSGNVVIGCVGLKPYTASAASAAAGSSSSSSSSAGSLAEAPTAELLRLAVHPQVRRVGVAGHLMAHLEAWARRASYKRIHLVMQDTSTAARALYVKGGYTQVGPPEGVKKSFRGDELTLMDFEKELT